MIHELLHTVFVDQIPGRIAKCKDIANIVEQHEEVFG